MHPVEVALYRRSVAPPEKERFQRIATVLFAWRTHWRIQRAGQCEDAVCAFGMIGSERLWWRVMPQEIV